MNALPSNEINNLSPLVVSNPKIPFLGLPPGDFFSQITIAVKHKTIKIKNAAVIDGIWYIIVSLVVTSYGMNDFFQKREGIIQKISGLILVLIGALLIIDFF